VRVTPRAARDRLEGWREGRLIVRTTAPPVAGQANDAVCRLIADAVGVARTQVQVVGGAHGREKTIRVTGLPADVLLRALGHPEDV